MHDAFKAWDLANESLESVEDRIHDGAPREKLHERASECALRVLAVPWLKVAPADKVVEVGPGVGYIMQAFARHSGVTSVTGLDVAPAMAEHGRERVRRDGISPDLLRFELYDGVTFPFPADSVDVFYSIAAIQHIPKPFAYNVMFEMQRCLRPGGTAFIQVLSWDFLPRQYMPFSEEIKNQVTGRTTHWHHYYDREELEAVLTHGLGVSQRILMPDGTSIWAAWRK